MIEQSTRTQPSAQEQEHVGLRAGDKQTMSLTHSAVMGQKITKRAKVTVTTVCNGKKQKIEQHVVSDEALALLIQLVRTVSHDGELYRVVRRFLEDRPSG